MKYIKYTQLTAPAVALLALVANQTQAQIQFPAGHIDIGMAFDTAAEEWDLHIHDEEIDMEYEPDELYFYGSEANSANFKLSAPGAGQFSFLGASGDDVFIFPQVEDINLPFIGLAAEENLPGDFIGDLLINMVSLTGGLGDFFIYQTDGFGNPTVYFDSSDGFSGSDQYTLGVGGHAHFNFAFTQEGFYTVGITATGTPTVTGEEETSPVAYYSFGVGVVPEPSSYALILGICAVGFTALRRRRA